MLSEANIKLPFEKPNKITKKLPIFYNPVMKFNRDITVLVLNAFIKYRKDKFNLNNAISIALPLAGSGIRAFRILNEIPIKAIKEININDIRDNFKKIIEEIISLNKDLFNDKSISKLKIFNKDANIFLREGDGFDYIDIDPFGSPNNFLDSAISKIKNKGLLTITATDTAALVGTYPNTC